MKINKHYLLPFSKEKVYNAWISEQSVVDPVFKIESQPEVGGHYILHTAMGDSELIMNGKFIEVLPNERLTYSWNWQGSPETTTVEVRFSDQDEGAKLELEHRGFQSEESLNMHDQGWDSYLKGLTQILSNS